MESIVQIAMTEEIDPIDLEALEESPACVLVFNASDPSGSGGLSADTLSIASIGAHALPVVTGAYMRDTAEIFDHRIPFKCALSCLCVINDGHGIVLSQLHAC